MPTVFERILKFNSDRIPELVKIKYHLMSADPFRFFRGTCHLFYEDLSENINWEDDTKAWICGDLHLENFGSYKGDNRVVYFDINDYDECILAPATWEIVRLLTSIHIAAQVLLLNKEKAILLCNDFIETYISTLKTGKALSIEKETATGIVRDFLKTVADRSDKELVRAKTYKKETLLSIDGRKLLELPTAIKEQVLDHVSKWFDGYYGNGMVKIHDAAYRVAGTGSVGIKRFVVLKENLKTGTKHLIDIKEAKPSSLKPYVKVAQPKWENEAERVKEIQKRGQYVQPAWLHSLEMDTTSYVIKEMQPIEDKMDLALCRGETKKLSEIIDTMANLVAAEQLRSSGRQSSSIADELIAFAANEKMWKQKVLDYAAQYAKNVLKDFEDYKKEYERSLSV